MNGDEKFPNKIFDLIKDNIPINDPGANTVIVLGKTPYESSIFVCGKELRGCTGMKITVDPIEGRTRVELEVIPVLVVDTPPSNCVVTKRKNIYNGILHMIKSFFRSIHKKINKEFYALRYGKNLTHGEWINANVVNYDKIEHNALTKAIVDAGYSVSKK
jgi:hypothetical protein